MLIRHATLITWEDTNRILEDHCLRVDGNIISDIGIDSVISEKYPGDDSWDVSGQLVMPGNICAHTHFYGAYSRGLYIPGKPARDFPEILNKLWWPLDKALTPEGIYYSAMVCLIDAIKHGTTTLFDHHASQTSIPGSLDHIAKAVLETGLRTSLCYEVTDRDGEEAARQGMDENIRFIKWLGNQPENIKEKLHATFGLHASLTLSDRTLQQCREQCPDGTGFHIHVAEHPVDEYDSLYKSGKRVVDRLMQHGILGDRTIVVHGVHIDIREVELLAQTKTWVSNQPRSNMNNGVGLPDVEGMLRAGINVCLGNDGFSNAMWDEWRAAYLSHKLKHNDPQRMPATSIIQMAVYNNRALANQSFLGGPMGIIVNGAKADLQIVDYKPYTPLTTDNLPWHIQFGFRDSMITGTMVDGQVLMKDRVLLTIDEEKITHEAIKLAPKIWERFDQFVK